jgi:5-hydroxyisourate hydrolase-like protein (transthyretin family)
MSLGWRTVLVVCVLTLVAGVAPWPQAAADGPAGLRLTAAAVPAGAPVDLVLTLEDAGGTALSGASVVVERQTGGTWQPAGTVVTDSAGRASVTLVTARSRADNAVRASYAGDAAHAPVTAETTLPLLRRAATVSLTGPARVVDERSATLEVRWRANDGTPVAGAVRIMRRLGSGSWRTHAVVETGDDGRATLRVTPRRDSRWQARAPQLDWVSPARSEVHAIDNRPPGRPVRLPAAAPRPRVQLPPQERAVGAGANLRIERIDDRTWRQMVGVSWHRGCPVGRAGLRIVQVNYWDYQGYRRRGELVAATSAAAAMGAALAEMYDRQLPIRAMYRVDRFGWGHRSQGADDYRVMAAGNTSAFNCRDVTGRPGRLSPHSWGRSLDVNPWENPYRSARGTVPNTWWQSRSHPLVAWRSRSHPVVRVMARHGLRWTYGLGDTQHFDYVGGGSARAAYDGPAPCRRYCD